MAGARINPVNASRVTTPAPPNRKYSVPIARDSIGGIVAYVSDNHRDSGARAESRRPQRPPTRDVAQVVDAQIHARQPDQTREREPRDQQRRAAPRPGPHTDRERPRQPWIEHRVGGVAARKARAAGPSEG